MLFRSYRALTRGMVAVAAGDAGEAERQSRRADALLDDPPLTLLLAAQAAQLRGDEAAAKRYFTAMLNRPDTAFLGVRGLLMQAERAGDTAEAKRLIARAYTMRPNTPWVLRSMLDDEARAGDWRAAQATLDRAARARALKDDEAREKRAAIVLARADAAHAAGDAAAALSFARAAMRLAPDWLPALVRRVALLAAAGRRRSAARIAERAWRRTPHPALAGIYAETGRAGEDGVAKLRRIERLAEANPSHPESAIAVAEAALDAKLWGIARATLARAAEGAPPARVCRLMARLEAEENRDGAAERGWLVRAAQAAPDPAWLCSACAHAAADWHALCPNCGAFATLDWRTPPRAPAVGAAAPPPRLAAQPAPDGSETDESVPAKPAREAEIDGVGRGA